MNIYVIANIISFSACLLLVATGLIKKRRNILIAQNGMFVLMSISYAILGGTGAIISNAISFVRNLICLKWDLGWKLKLLFLGVQGILTAVTNTAGLLGWIPFISVCIYTAFIDTKNEVVLKISLIFSQACWIIYDFSFKNYSAFAFDIFTVISTIVGIFMILNDRKKSEQEIKE